MWTSWYSPKRWELWAQSASPYISRLRTTMGVENFWRQLKHEFLHNYVRPQLDLLIWILITLVTPQYIIRANNLEDTSRLGRSRTLTTYQRYFKQHWKRLQKKPANMAAYEIDVANWTCTCGLQKYQRHHICQHLVKSVPTPKASFWQQIGRRRVSPVYRHPDLVQLNPDGSRPPSDTLYDPNDGCITDGDDHVWLGDKEILSGGRWRDMDTSKLGKCARSPSRTRSPLQPSPDTDMADGTSEYNSEEEDEVRLTQNYRFYTTDIRL